MAKSYSFKVIDPVGLHARPASLLVTVCSKCASDITLEYNGKSVNAKSIMGVMGMGIPTQSEVTVTAVGTDEETAIETIAKFLKDNKVTE